MGEDHHAHFQNNIHINVMASGISLELANYLKHKGFPSVPLSANTAYRTDTNNGIYDEKPPISHRYLAVRSGVGFFGLSGNVLTKTDGAAIILGSVVTEADLIPTEPIPAEENYCDDCRLCKAACASGFIDGEEKITITMGGVVTMFAAGLPVYINPASGRRGHPGDSPYRITTTNSFRRSSIPLAPI